MTNRRDFLKLLGAGTAAVAAMATVGSTSSCSQAPQTKAEGTSLGEVPVGQMTMRENLHGEQVSLLGYG